MLQEKGRGNKLNAALVIVCGVAALVSSLLSFVYALGLKYCGTR
jgi:hypothetical protein